MKTVTCQSLDSLAAEAAANPRRRRNLNIHAAEQAPCQRLFNALEPDSYVAPHRHLDPAKDETFVWIRGRLGVVEFTAEGGVASVAELAPGKAVTATIPSGAFHTVFALEPGSVFFESKAGPYRPLSPDERASWAPPEGSPGSAACLAELKSTLLRRP